MASGLGASSCFMPPPVNSNVQTERRKGKSIKDQPNKSHSRCRTWTSPHEKGYVSLVYNINSLRYDRLCLPLPFMRANGLETPGITYLVGKDGVKTPVILLRSNTGRMSIGKGWNHFAQVNGIKPRESFGLKLVWEDTSPVFHLTSSRGTCEKGSTSTKPKKERRTSSAIQNQVLAQPYEDRWNKENLEERRLLASANGDRVLLILSSDDAQQCKLCLPTHFMEASGIIDKLGDITILGKTGTKWRGNLSGDGTVSLSTGWEDFCESNGVKVGNLFTLEFKYEPNKPLMFKFSKYED